MDRKFGTLLLVRFHISSMIWMIRSIWKVNQVTGLNMIGLFTERYFQRDSSLIGSVEYVRVFYVSVYWKLQLHYAIFCHMQPSQSLIFTLSVIVESCPHETSSKHVNLVELGRLTNFASVRMSHLIQLYSDCR